MPHRAYVVLMIELHPNRSMETKTSDPAPFEDAVKDLVEQIRNADPQVSDLISVVDGTTIQWVDFVLAGKRNLLHTVFARVWHTLSCHVHHWGAQLTEGFSVPNTIILVQEVACLGSLMLGSHTFWRRPASASGDVQPGL